MILQYLTLFCLHLHYIPFHCIFSPYFILPYLTAALVLPQRATSGFHLYFYSFFNYFFNPFYFFFFFLFFFSLFFFFFLPFFVLVVLFPALWSFPWLAGALTEARGHIQYNINSSILSIIVYEVLVGTAITPIPILVTVTARSITAGLTQPDAAFVLFFSVTINTVRIAESTHFFCFPVTLAIYSIYRICLYIYIYVYYLNTFSWVYLSATVTLICFCFASALLWFYLPCSASSRLPLPRAAVTGLPCPALPCPVLPCLGLLCLALPCPSLVYFSSPCFVLLYHVGLFCFAFLYFYLPCSALPCFVLYFDLPCFTFLWFALPSNVIIFIYLFLKALPWDQACRASSVSPPETSKTCPSSAAKDRRRTTGSSRTSWRQGTLWVAKGGGRGEGSCRGLVNGNGGGAVNSWWM